MKINIVEATMPLPVLPEIHTLGTLDPHTMILELPEASKAELEKAMAGEANQRTAEIYAHEVKHFQDLLGTVWGQDYLDVLFEAYDAVLSKPSLEFASPALIKLFDVDRSILFPSYYKYVMPSALKGSVDDRWTMSFSTDARILPDGRSDETNPIIFVRFDKGTIHIARQPVTVGALLELRAIGAELGSLLSWLQRQPKEVAAVEEAIRSREFLEIIYDPHLTTYSVAAHIVANAIGASEFSLALDTGCKISEIALNLTGNSFSKLHKSGLIGAEMGRERERGFKSRRDRGFAFVNLLFHLRGITNGATNEAHIELCLKRAGLQKIDDIHNAARRRISEKHDAKFEDEKLKHIRGRLVEAGLTILQRRDFDKPMLSASAKNLPGPLIMTGRDLAEFHQGYATISAQETMYLYNCYSMVRDATRQALRAARGFEFGWSDFVY